MSEFVLPPEIKEKLLEYIKPEALDGVLHRPATCWGGLNAIEYAADHGWQPVLDLFEKTFNWSVTQ